VGWELGTDERTIKNTATVDVQHGCTAYVILVLMYTGITGP
jgi:hypothetical protein